MADRKWNIDIFRSLLLKAWRIFNTLGAVSTFLIHNAVLRVLCTHTLLPSVIGQYWLFFWSTHISTLNFTLAKRIDNFTTELKHIDLVFWRLDNEKILIMPYIWMKRITFFIIISKFYIQKTIPKNLTFWKVWKLIIIKIQDVY